MIQNTEKQKAELPPNIVAALFLFPCYFLAKERLSALFI